MIRPKPAAPAAPALPQARATIDDVARLAGVSKATVSRVLNRRDDLLTPDIAQRVQAAMAQLAYSPSPMAQALKRGRSRLIGLVVADVGNPYSVAVLRGAEKACRQAGYLVMLFNLGSDGPGEREAIQALSSYPVEGFILHTLGRDSAGLDEAARHGKPVVLVDRRPGDAQLDFVGLDNAAALRIAARHLLDAGYRRLLFVSEPLQGGSPRQERAATFLAFVAEQAGACSGEVLELAQGDMPKGEGSAATAALDAALRTLGAGPRSRTQRPAVIAANAVVALAVAAAAARLNRRFGAELGLVAFDDPDWAALIGPGLTTIAQPTDDIGRLAARCLIERLEGEAGPPRQILLQGRLVPRGSTRVR